MNIYMKFNPLTPTLAKTGHDGTTDLLPFVTSSLFMINDVFPDQLKQKDEIFQKCPNKRDLMNWRSEKNEEKEKSSFWLFFLIQKPSQNFPL